MPLLRNPLTALGALLLVGLSACHMGGDESPTTITMRFDEPSVQVLHGRFSMRVGEHDTEAQEIGVAIECGDTVETFVAGPLAPTETYCDTQFQVLEIMSTDGEARSARIRLSWED